MDLAQTRGTKRLGIEEIEQLAQSATELGLDRGFHLLLRDGSDIVLK